MVTARDDRSNLGVTSAFAPRNARTGALKNARRGKSRAPLLRWAMTAFLHGLGRLGEPANDRQLALQLELPEFAN